MNITLMDLQWCQTKEKGHGLDLGEQRLKVELVVERDYGAPTARSLGIPETLASSFMEKKLS